MSNWKKFFEYKQIRLLDHSHPKKNATAMDDFAIDDALALSVSQQISPPVIRLWVHDQTVVLGIPDAKLPYKEDAIEYLQQQGYQPVVRNSGGLAVVLDAGTLNLSLLLPNGKKLGIHEGYEIMVSFIKDILRDEDATIEAFEIVGSYCPGDYDLSINGKKFAGISQRRVRNGIAVQIYISITGEGEARAQLIQTFYEKGLRGETGKFDYPHVIPETMQSLSQLLDKSLQIDDVKQKIKKTLTAAKIDWRLASLTEAEEQTYQKRKQQMINRNEKALGNLL